MLANVDRLRFPDKLGHLLTDKRRSTVRSVADPRPECVLQEGEQPEARQSSEQQEQQLTYSLMLSCREFAES